VIAASLLLAACATDYTVARANRAL